jgi:hypothetical protein
MSERTEQRRYVVPDRGDRQRITSHVFFPFLSAGPEFAHSVLAVLEQGPWCGGGCTCVMFGGVAMTCSTGGLSSFHLELLSGLLVASLGLLLAEGVPNPAGVLFFLALR